MFGLFFFPIRFYALREAFDRREKSIVPWDTFRASATQKIRQSFSRDMSDLTFHCTLDVFDLRQISLSLLLSVQISTIRYVNKKCRIFLKYLKIYFWSFTWDQQKREWEASKQCENCRLHSHEQKWKLERSNRWWSQVERKSKIYKKRMLMSFFIWHEVDFRSGKWDDNVRICYTVECVWLKLSCHSVSDFSRDNEIQLAAAIALAHDAARDNKERFNLIRNRVTLEKRLLTCPRKKKERKVYENSIWDHSLHSSASANDRRKCLA